MASVNPYVLQGNVGIELQQKMEDTMARVQMLGIQEMNRREDMFVKMMDVETVNLVKDKASAQQLKDLDTYNQEAAKIAIASNYNPTPQERLKLNNLKRDFLQSQQSLLASQQAWAKDREALAMDKGQRFDTDMGMETINEWDGISPYTQGQALTLVPKRRISDVVTDVLNESFPYNKSASSYIRDKKSDGSYTKVTEHSRVGLHKVGPDGRPVKDEEAVNKVYSMLQSDKDLQYATSYLLEKEVRAKAENIMLTQKVSKDKARSIAEEEMMKKWNASSVDDIKNQYLKFYTEGLLNPQITDEQKVQGNGSNFNLSLGGHKGYTFGWDEDSKTVSLVSGKGKTTFDSKAMGVKTYKGDIPFSLVSFTPKTLSGLSYKYAGPDLKGEGVDSETHAARKYPNGYMKASDGKFYPLLQGEEVSYTIPATKYALNKLGPAIVAEYKARYANDPDNVFNKKSGSEAPVVGDKAPIRANYKSVLDYNAALSAWNKAHPKK